MTLQQYTLLLSPRPQLCQRGEHETLQVPEKPQRKTQQFATTIDVGPRSITDGQMQRITTDYTCRMPTFYPGPEGTGGPVTILGDAESDEERLSQAI